MAISASYDNISQDLTVAGDTADNTITVSRNAGGTLFVNGGAVPISGGPATVANTDLIAISGDVGNDTISLDETNGALPAAELAGGDGNDSLTGGSGADVLQGEVGNDTLLGRAGADMLYGGNGVDMLVGGAGNDELFGDAGNDVLVWNSGDGSDVWEGGDDADTATINGGNGGETFTIAANGTRVQFDRTDPAPFALDIGTTEFLGLHAGGGDDTINTSGNLASLISLTLDGGAGSDTISGSNGADLLFGGDGNDFVDGNQGNDTAFLGDGADTFSWDPGDGSDVVDGEAGTDTLQFNASNVGEQCVLSVNGSRARLDRDVGTVSLDLNGVEKVTINALGGTDRMTINNMVGTEVSAVTVNLAGTLGGSSGDGAVDTVVLNGSAGKDVVTLTDAAGQMTATGFAETVTLNQVEATDLVTVQGGDGNDTISAAAVSYGVATVSVDGGSGNDTIYSSGDGQYSGGIGDDRIYAGLTSSYETLDGGDGTDTLDTTTWNGVYDIDMVTGETDYAESFINFENLITGNGPDTITGTDGNNVIQTQGGTDTINAGAGNDTLDGGTGTDTLAGGTGNDKYYVDDASDVVTENAGEGTDTVLASVSYTLAAGVEVERLSTTNAAGTGAIDLTGNEFNNTITGNAGSNSLTGGGGDDILDGGLGDDTMSGGTGNDTYYVNSRGDVVVENDGEGNDTMAVGFSYALAEHSTIENLATIDPTATTAINLTGNSSDNVITDGVNTLTGNAGANVLDGKGGGDTMRGLGGNDIYVVDDVGDVVTEGVSAGTDLVRSFITYALGANLENLTLMGAAAINGSGNSLGNVIRGNDAANTLNGQGGADSLIGGLGDDIYIIDNSGDTVSEGASAGTDLVKSSISFTLGGNVENLTLTGSALINATGNSLANTLTGNAAANTLDGKAGADTMKGGQGDDIYVIDNAGDVVTEAASAGLDLVRSTISYTLGANVEELTLMGTAAINASGNSAGNLIKGNDAANVLGGAEGNDTIAGHAGNDVLYGGLGDDSLDGGAGADQLVFNTALGAANIDTIYAFSVADDTLVLKHTIFTQAGSPGTLAAGAFHIGATAADAGDRIIYDNTNGDIYYDDDGTGADAQILFAHVGVGQALTNADFLIVA